MKISQQASEHISDLYSHADEILLELGNDPDFLEDPFSSKVSAELSLKQESGLHFVMYKDSKSVYWSSNKVPLPNGIPISSEMSNLQWIGNGWYYPVSRQEGPYTIIALIRISQEFPFQNSYLRNSFTSGINIPDNIILFPDRGDYNVYINDTDFLFSIQAGDDKPAPGRLTYLYVLLAFLGYILLLWLLYGLHFRLNPFHSKPELPILLFALDVIIVRVILQAFSWPSYLYESSFFQPFTYSAGFLFNSPGELSLNIISFLAIALALSIHSRRQFQEPTWKYSAFFLPLTGFFLSAVSLVFAAQVTKSIFLHSYLNLNLSNLFSFTPYSVYFFVLIVLVYTSALLISASLNNRFLLPFRRKAHALFGMISGALLFLLLALIFGEGLWMGLILTSAFLVISLLSAGKKQHSFNLLAALLSVLLVSVVCTIQHNNLNTIKEKQERILLADVLSQEQDPVSEYLFKEAYSDMGQDRNIHALVNADTLEEDILTRYLLYEYFSKDSHWEGYNFQVTICSPLQQLIIESDIGPEYSSIVCDTFFIGLARERGRMTLSKNLFYIDYGTGQDSYLGILRFERLSGEYSGPLTVYIEFTSKDVRSDLGFPSLLTDNTDRASSPYSYSYAFYNNGKLSSSYGKFTYNIDLVNYGDSIASFSFFEGSDFHNTYDHLYHYINDNRILLLSKAKPGVLETISPLSYFFLLFMLVFLFIVLFFMGSDGFQIPGPSFRSRLQFTLLGIIIISFVTIGLASMSYLRNLNRQKNYDVLTEKAHSVLIEVEHKLSDVDSLSPEITPYLTKILTKFSRVFFTDINLFDLDGVLLASSRTQIFDEQLISTQMHPEAFRLMSVDERSFFIHRESIGDLQYLSAYIPFRNDQDELVAYLNLPYFIKEKELQTEITAFLVTFININALLIALSIIMALFFSNLITRPLRLIRDSLRKVRLDSSNARIEMNRTDEIGELVGEYNRMVDELGRSAELLAVSERQSAWREMAKQVAHEIKNPLTPMKLSVQYLEKAWKDKDPDWESRLIRFTSTIVEQIDSLSQIATEFSDFAKMPESRKEKVFLEHILSNSSEIFGEIDDIDLKFHYDPGSSYPVYADKKQLLRAFNNLIKNARQAMEGRKDGRIDIILSNIDTMHRVEIHDNGHGIDATQADRIFTPNFTTRSGGMGLGLAIVKSIIEDSNAQISFTSEAGKGTTFTIIIPAYSETNPN